MSKTTLPGCWLGLTADTTEEEARAAFRRKYGTEPAEVIRLKVCVLVGPLPGTVEHPPGIGEQLKLWEV
jgi:hypothetical protein